MKSINHPSGKRRARRPALTSKSLTKSGTFTRYCLSRAYAVLAGRYRSRLSQTRETEPDVQRRRSATAQAGDAIKTRRQPRGERADSKNAQAWIDTVFTGGTDYWPSYGRR